MAFEPGGMELLLDSRFNGPDGSANGGYTCGRLAALLGSACTEVTLRLPPPLDKQLVVERHEQGLSLLDGDKLVAQAKSGELDLEVPPVPALEQAEAASKRYCGHTDHPFPNCFVCGPDRKVGDGLNIFAGPLEGTDRVAATWLPDPGLGDEEGKVRDEFLWCALDCPGAFAVDQQLETPQVLGRLVAQIFDSPKVGEPLIIIGWPLGTERRKAFAGTALYDPSGRLYAAARAIWIKI